MTKNKMNSCIKNKKIRAVAAQITGSDGKQLHKERKNKISSLRSDGILHSNREVFIFDEQNYPELRKQE